MIALGYDELTPPRVAGSGQGRLALAAPDLGAAIEFYVTHLGMDRVPDDSATFRLGDDSITLVISLPPATTPINHLGLTTADGRPDAHDPGGNRLVFVQCTDSNCPSVRLNLRQEVGAADI